MVIPPYSLALAKLSRNVLQVGNLGHLKKTIYPRYGSYGNFVPKILEVKEGDVVKVDLFSVGERVDVVGTSKGRGFLVLSNDIISAGGPKTHGQSDRHRAPGSRESGTTPGRIYKGERGPGHMGDDRVTSQNLKTRTRRLLNGIYWVFAVRYLVHAVVWS